MVTDWSEWKTLNNGRCKHLCDWSKTWKLISSTTGTCSTGGAKLCRYRKFKPRFQFAHRNLPYGPSFHTAIEEGRYHRPRIPRDECIRCQVAEITNDEFHFVMSRPAYSQLREEAFNELSFTDVKSIFPKEKLVFLMSASSGDTEVADVVATFIITAL